MKKIALITIYSLLIAAPLAQAAGLVPCGGLSEPACNFCYLTQTAKNVIDFMLGKVLFPIAAIMIVWGGIVIMTARESPERVKQGRGIITAAVVGILIALLSWLVLDTIFKVVAVGWDATGIGPWNQLKCQ